MYLAHDTLKPIYIYINAGKNLCFVIFNNLKAKIWTGLMNWKVTCPFQVKDSIMHTRLYLNICAGKDCVQYTSVILQDSMKLKLQSYARILNELAKEISQ